MLDETDTGDGGPRGKFNFGPGGMATALALISRSQLDRLGSFLTHHLVLVLVVTYGSCWSRRSCS